MPTLLSSKDNRKSYLIGQPLLTSLLLWKSEIVEILGLDSVQLTLRLSFPFESYIIHLKNGKILSISIGFKEKRGWKGDSTPFVEGKKDHQVRLDRVIESVWLQGILSALLPTKFNTFRHLINSRHHLRICWVNKLWNTTHFLPKGKGFEKTS
ncbi:hypothetical protein CDAR_367871 [Caerostris darwini]|uniref:Uncharacterized protein n=1 Tax=Caerostris darwini TaxID=1538125 RepID=A0AAV4R029_9ARAC|nr:hypothetical protein CDAR_367871 [Caerostris darwini]